MTTFSLEKKAQEASTTAPPNEEEEPKVNVPGNAVTPAELDAASLAIQRTFQEALHLQQQQKRSKASSSSSSSSSATANANAITQHLLKEGQQALVQRLETMVSPTAEDDLHEFLHFYNVIPEYDDEEYEQDQALEEELAKVQAELKTMSPQDFLEEVRTELGPEDIDEDHDLLDTKAWEDAQKLRQAVREVAARVQEARNQVVTESTRHSLAETQTALDRVAPEILPPLSEDSESSQQDLQVSLQALSELLQDSKWAQIPQEMERLQKTLQVVRKETSKDRPLSQTEVAIVSRTNSEDHEDVTNHKHLWQSSTYSNEDATTAKNLLSAADRLAMHFEYLQ